MIYEGIYHQYHLNKIINSLDFIVSYDMLKVPDDMILSSIGAKICVTPQGKDIITEKISNNKSRVEYLKRLLDQKHYSIFAHSPVFIKLPYDHHWLYETGLVWLLTAYKVYSYIDYANIYLVLNMRHLIEFMKHSGEITNYITKIFNKLTKKTCSVIDKKLKKYTMLLDFDINYCPKNEDLIPKLEAYVIKNPYDNYYLDWISIIFYNVSVIFTHQFVRHTILNFNQQSSRYTDETNYILPVDDEDITKHINDTIKLYQEKRKNMSRETLRYMLPSGRICNIMASAPYYVWRDFINKRDIPQASYEIRTIAQKINELLEFV